MKVCNVWYFNDFVLIWKDVIIFIYLKFYLIIELIIRLIFFYLVVYLWYLCYVIIKIDNYIKM